MVEPLLHGFRALVTGASKGIGRSICCELARNGAEVAGVARSESDLRSLAAAIQQEGGVFLPIAGDVTNPDAVRALVERLGRSWNHLDALINNAGGAIGFGDFFTTDDDQWRATFDLNVMSIVRMVKASLPLLRRSSGASITNILSAVAKQPGWMYPHYSACKAAGLNLTKHLSLRLAREGIRVNSISPGPVHSSSWEEGLQGHAARLGLPVDAVRDEFERAEREKVPLGRIGEGEDVAGLALWLVSGRAGWVTGSDFIIDGGKSRSI